MAATSGKGSEAGSGKSQAMKLIFHQKSYKSDNQELLLNPQESGFGPGDILEIYHKKTNNADSRPLPAYPRLLLQVPRTPSTEENIAKGTISVEQSISAQFRLQRFEMVQVTKIEPEKVALQLLEVTFKDQYLNRSDMWRLTQHLEGCVVYKNKIVEFCGQTIRCQVYEMWSQGSRVACGYVSADTKVVYRSSTSRFYLFIQMSSEMWEFDHFGDLLFEKAVSGFLTELFDKWKKMNTNHDVTIVLFSRSFYPTAKSLDEFPGDMRSCIQRDHLGRYFQDFYRVAVQNERHEDWSCVLRTLRQLFYHYPSAVLGRQTIHGETLLDVRDTHLQRSASKAPNKTTDVDHDDHSRRTLHRSPNSTKQFSEKCKNLKPPRAELSTADEGNFLEVLNMSLNVFEKHYTDRSMERTGQMSVVVTPGVGVFQVDRALANITKQRIIDNGVGSDLVCLGEQPLHAVPLLKFQRRQGGGNDYSMPHNWINLSFYSSIKRSRRAAMGDLYVPRIHVPEHCIPSFYPNAHSRNSRHPFGERRPTSSRHHVSNLLEPLQPAPSISLSCPASIILDHARGAELLKLKWGLSHMSQSKQSSSTKPVKPRGTTCKQFPNCSDTETAKATGVNSKESDYSFKKPASSNGKDAEPGKSSSYKGFEAVSRKSSSGQDTTAGRAGRTDAEGRSSRADAEGRSSGTDAEGRSSRTDAEGRSCRTDAEGFSHHPASNADFRSDMTTAELEAHMNAYDEAIFKYPVKPYGTGTSDTEGGGVTATPPTATSYRVHYTRQSSQSYGALNLELGDAAAAAVAASEEDLEAPPAYDAIRGGAPPLINPFDPKYTTIRLTSYRRRWVHIFPKNVSGALIQQHHKEDVALKKDLTTYPSSSEDELETDVLGNLQEEESPVGAPVNTHDNLEMGRNNAPAAGNDATGSTSSSRPPSMLGIHKHRASLGHLGPTAHDTLLWGATGEQEWSAAITTGVDWKSLTLPACLPITTDFFPSEESIEKDYVLSNYALLPDDINEPLNAPHNVSASSSSSQALPATFGRSHMTAAQVFKELVSQRLSQGFQLILPKDDVARSGHGLRRRRKKRSLTASQEWQSTSSQGGGRGTTGGGSAAFRYAGSPGLPALEMKPHVGSRSADHHPEYKLSIGTLFHKLKLVGNNRIEASVYRPRIMSETLTKDYKYRFCAPYMTGYELSSTKFQTERLDRYKWNYLDNYVSLYSDSFENPLIEELKYWRMRMVVVPDLYCSILRQLMDDWKNFPDAGIYSPPSSLQRSAINESFIKFFEMIHRIKRQVVKRPKMPAQGVFPNLDSGSMPGNPGSSGVRERSMSAREGPVQQSNASLVRERMLSGSSGPDVSTKQLNIPDLNGDIRAREALFPSEGMVSSIAQSTVSSSQSPNITAALVEGKRSLSSDSDLADIAAAMKSTGTGLNFFSPPHSSLPPLSFLSTDAVVWLREHVSNVNTHTDAMNLLQRLCSDDYIRHASGHQRTTVYYGFYIYFLVTGDKEQDRTSNPDTYCQEFHEVEIKPVEAYGNYPYAQDSPSVVDDSAALPPFLQRDLPPLAQPFRTSAGRLVSLGPISIDPHRRSDRSEWGDLVCTSSFSCDSAYLFSLRWMCASGPLVAELIALWQRRAASCNLFLFPIPSDPFALPHSLDCDPLRGPLHLPLVMSCNPPCTASRGLGSPSSATDEKGSSSHIKNKLRPALRLCPKHDVFAKFPSNTRPLRTRLLQEAILAKYGFVRLQNDLMASTSSVPSNDHNQFVHVSGNAFVMVLTPGIVDIQPDSHASVTVVSGAADSGTEDSAPVAPSFTPARFTDPPLPRPSSLLIEVMGVESSSSVGSLVASPHEEYFHRLMSEHHKASAAPSAAHAAACNSDKSRFCLQQSPGFLWSFNYMMSKRWKAAASGEEAFGELLLHDFKNFCANKNDRLSKFIESFNVKEESCASVCDDVFSAS
ncbi:GATOR complex protein Iml1 [Hyalella azteca]|uniref:GATOR complex protein Iml1 n=1 Tax=Hyalella azteca TaxID=294128 RepID=A0A979FXE6_HYAAZ|nr:GATOR complex protein Iml1 [Hyalella azteca]